MPRRLPIVVPMATCLRAIAILASAIVALSFATFAVDEIDRGSKTQQALVSSELGQPAPPPSVERVREQQHGKVRELVDDGNDVLLAPFAGLFDSNSAWLTRGVPALIGLLVYGLGLGLIANYLPKPKPRGGDWRTA
jgi:hypothetical protein